MDSDRRGSLGVHVRLHTRRIYFHVTRTGAKFRNHGAIVCWKLVVNLCVLGYLELVAWLFWDGLSGPQALDKRKTSPRKKTA